MKIQLSEIDRRIIERVCEITEETTDIDADNYIEVDTILAILDSLEDSYKDLEDEYNTYREMISDNYKPIEVNDSHRYYVNTIENLSLEADKMHKFIKEKGLLEEYGEYNY